MSRPRPFRFGVQASSAKDGKSWIDLARRVEDLGFSTLLVPDHLGCRLAPIPALAAAAQATTRLRVGGLVFDTEFKHPVVLAKELATLDLLSGGRLEVGLGAGWLRTDGTLPGMADDGPRERVDRFLEGLTIIKGVFGDEEYSFAGRHYTVSAVDGQPKPVQSPPPIMIVAGDPTMLRIAARHADIININPSLRSGHVDLAAVADGTASAFDGKVDVLKQAAGVRFDALELSCLMFFVNRTVDPGVLATTVAPMFGLTPQEMLDSPLALFGSCDQMVESLQARRDRWGVSYLVCRADSIYELAPVVERLAGT